MENDIKRIIIRALKEDLSHRDITTNILFDKAKRSEAYIMTREEAMICGSEIVKNVFRMLDPSMKVSCLHKDGDLVRKNTVIMRFKGRTRALLSGERTALNFLSYLSGISTLTNQYVKAIKGYPAHILDTRKTTPGLRTLEKMAVRVGGGKNHRFNLNDMVMIKDNHRIAQARQSSIQDAIKKVRQRTSKPLCVEVDNLEEYKQALQADPCIILLDNMSTSQMKKAVEIRACLKKKFLLEASGGITLKNIRQVAKTGIDRISIGAITHSPPTIDFTMEFEQ
ncbi:MAG TPA: carboxylating nicotinate-nucleotide diphosphorylase [Candidatus Omnitrophota bacterium]|nr:carboxylating nicotinate-nucleotide diphosphorylase [Candidatus Omnitrophota bacterium]HSA31297.1 carboxylating nicotinate-nucleotide diphosphorylase [Candidatus Omnitrophota bacterium]